MLKETSDLPLIKLHSAELSERYVKHLKFKDANEMYNLYYFKGEIGQGSFGTVVEVIEKCSNKVFAIKIIQKSKVQKWKELQNEIKIMKFVNHPHIICLDSIYETPRKMYIVLEKCEKTLEKVYRESGVMLEKIIKVIIYDLTDAVHYLHTNNIVHRDIKMENILMARNETDPKDENFIKLTDFGLSVIKSGRGVQNMIQDFCGTISYMSPEIVEHKAYSELCDVWAIGVIFYQLYFGQRPFRGANDLEIRQKIIKDEPTFETTQITRFNDEAIHLMKSMLKKSPSDRITTALAMDHPYLTKKKISAFLPDYNVLNTMSKWKDEMKVENKNEKKKDWDKNLFEFQRFE